MEAVVRREGLPQGGSPPVRQRLEALVSLHGAPLPPPAHSSEAELSVLATGETACVRTHRFVVAQTERIAVEAFQNDCAGKPRRNENSPIRVLVEPDASVLGTIELPSRTSLNLARSNG